MVPAESKTKRIFTTGSETVGRAMCLTSTRNHMLRLHRCSTNSSRVQNEFLRVDPAPRLSAQRHGSTQLRGPGKNWKAQTCLFKVSSIADCPFLATKQPRIQGDPTRRVFVTRGCRSIHWHHAHSVNCHAPALDVSHTFVLFAAVCPGVGNMANTVVMQWICLFHTASKKEISAPDHLCFETTNSI